MRILIWLMLLSFWDYGVVSLECYSCLSADTPVSCSITQQCAQGEICLLHLRQDNQTQKLYYETMCSDKKACLDEMATHGLMVTGGRKRFTDSIFVGGLCTNQCCDEHLCNRGCNETIMKETLPPASRNPTTASIPSTTVLLVPTTPAKPVTNTTVDIIVPTKPSVTSSVAPPVTPTTPPTLAPTTPPLTSQPTTSTTPVTKVTTLTHNTSPHSTTGTHGLSSTQSHFSTSSSTQQQSTAATSPTAAAGTTTTTTTKTSTQPSTPSTTATVPTTTARTTPSTTTQPHVYMNLTCPRGLESFDTSCYAFVNHEMTFGQTMNYCTQRSAYLVHVNSMAENAFIVDHLKHTHSGPVVYWLGISDQQTEGRWQYLGTLQDVTFTDWAPNEPDDKHDLDGDTDTADCAVLMPDMNWKWRDSGCSFYEMAQPICELRNPSML